MKPIQLLLALLSLTPLSALSAPPPVDYQREIQPIFDQYCVACHACFDAPCQLNLGSADGLLRGASKTPVYNGTRMEAAAPTRLFIDASSTAEWRQKGFFPVHQSWPGQPSVLSQMLAVKAAQPPKPNQPLPKDLDLGINRSNECPRAADMGNYGEQHPHAGMPFALPEIPQQERELLQRWLAEGAPVPLTSTAAAAQDLDDIQRWEQYLNRPGHGEQLLARWLFEHWDVAQLYWPDNHSNQFYRLVRSRTATGEPVAEIATRRPNMDAGGRFYYRFRPVTGTRVYKTHIPFPLDNALLQRIEADFQPGNNAPVFLPGFTADERANPFTTFAALPAEARYRFMLDHAEYFIRTFIRGPVCRGQLATDVIRDHFWVIFQDPAHDPFITRPHYRKAVSPLLSLPGIDTDLLDGAKNWFDTEHDRNHYVQLRQDELVKLEPQGPGLDSIWSDNGNAMLTVFRHHDSATVKRGWVGQLPGTSWWMDYPLLERSYYNLVVNFDVFGALPHQLQTRLYFDLIRNGAEQNFLRLLPAEARKAQIRQWYKGSGKLKRWLSYEELDLRQPTRLPLTSKQPYRELLTLLLEQQQSINASAHDLNRCRSDCNATERLLQRLAQGNAASMPAIEQLPDTTLLRLRNDAGHDELYTLIRNRYHSNVAFILGEELRYEAEKDTLTVVPGIATGYPNFIIDIEQSQLPVLIDTLTAKQVNSQTRFVKTLVDHWGLRRSHPDFWPVFSQINAMIQADDPVNAGLLDLNRYIDFR